MNGLKRLAAASLLVLLLGAAACGVKGPPEYPSGPLDEGVSNPERAD